MKFNWHRMNFNSCMVRQVWQFDLLATWACTVSQNRPHSPWKDNPIEEYEHRHWNILFQLWFLDTALWLCPSQLTNPEMDLIAALPIWMQNSFWTSILFADNNSVISQTFVLYKILRHKHAVLHRQQQNNRLPELPFQLIWATTHAPMTSTALSML